VPEPSTPEPASPGEARRLSEVAAAIRHRAGPDGFVPFDEFQAQALYAPAIGYYNAPGRRLGTSGDFYTAAHVTPLFGATVADRVIAEHERLGRPRRFRVVEMGPGDGTLARSLLTELAQALPPDADWEYVLVERSTSLRDLALQRLAGSDHAARVRAAPSLAADGPFTGVVLANEFLDAQPVRRLRFGPGGWRELGVRWDGTRFVEADASARAVVGPPLPDVAPEGAIFEFSPAAEGFVRELSDHLARGTALVLDYGSEESLLLQRHPLGTLQAIRGHQALDDPLDLPGSADLSTFVNFTRIRATARSVGLVEQYYGSQAEALGAWGFERRFQDALGTVRTPEEEVKLRLSAKNLLFGFDSFRALEWRAGGGPAST